MYIMASKAHNFEDKIRTKDVLIDQQLNFNALLLSNQTLIGLEKCGFRIPSPIQLKAIPIGRCGFDLIVKSKSGTGKTAVFSIIALELVHIKRNAVQVLILAPTREVAVQIDDVLKSIGTGFEGLAVQSFIGGFPIDQDIAKLKKCHIAVGAPGRIKHLIDLGMLKTQTVKLVILDEADKLLDSEMKADIQYILKKLSSTKQIIASSATYSNDTLTYLNNIMSGPTLVEPDTDTPLLLGIKQFVSVVKSNLNVVQQLNIKNEELNRLLSQISFSQCLVFTNYQIRTESISNIINRKGWNSAFISAAQSQAERLKAINLFKEGKCRILLSTDITARGIDAANIDLVINYDVPSEASTYLHRMGRAGRFGSHGSCITMAASGNDLTAYCTILGEIGGANIFVPQLPNDVTLPNDLWNTDTSSFELIQGKLTDDVKSRKDNIAVSIANLKTERNNLKKKKKDVNHEVHADDFKEEPGKVEEKSCLIDEHQDTENEKDVDTTNQSINIPQAVDILLETNRKKDEILKTQVDVQNALSLLKNLASGEEAFKSEISQEKVNSQQHLLGDILADMSNSKKRKRVPENVSASVQMEANDNLNQTKCKNLALLNATKLLSESYGTTEISEETSSALQAYLPILSENKFKEITPSCGKEELLNAIVEGEVKSIPNTLTTVDLTTCTFDTEQALETDEHCSGDIEDIFKLSYDYAMHSGKTHWLNALGQELEEKMSLKEADQHQFSDEVAHTSLKLPKKRKHKSKNKKTFKDLTQNNKKDNTDYDQSMETYMNQELTNVENQSNYYATDLYPEYLQNEHYTSCFDYYSGELSQNLQTFEDVESFNTWFNNWQWQVQGIRDYVQQNLYIQEMNMYASSKYT